MALISPLTAPTSASDPATPLAGEAVGASVPGRRLAAAAALALLVAILVLTFRAWLQPDMLLELAGLVLCN